MIWGGILFVPSRKSFTRPKHATKLYVGGSEKRDKGLTCRTKFNSEWNGNNTLQIYACAAPASDVGL
jgi:hypothetical protein